MKRINNLKDLKRYKAGLKKNIRDMEKDFKSEFSYFQYGLYAAKTLKKWGGAEKLAGWSKNLLFLLLRSVITGFQNIFLGILRKPALLLLFLAAAVASIYSPGSSSPKGKLPDSTLQ